LHRFADADHWFVDHQSLGSSFRTLDSDILPLANADERRAVDLDDIQSLVNACKTSGEYSTLIRFLGSNMGVSFWFSGLFICSGGLFYLHISFHSVSIQYWRLVYEGALLNED